MKNNHANFVSQLLKTMGQRFEAKMFRLLLEPARTRYQAADSGDRVEFNPDRASFVSPLETLQR